MRFEQSQATQIARRQRRIKSQPASFAGWLFHAYTGHAVLSAVKGGLRDYGDTFTQSPNLMIADSSDARRAAERFGKARALSVPIESELS